MSPSRRVQRMLRRALTTEEAAARAQMRLLIALRRAVLAAMGEALAYRSFHLSAMLGVIDREIARGRANAVAAAAGSTRDSWALGLELVDTAIIVPGGIPSLAGLSSELLHAALDVTSDQVRAVWSELGTRLKVIVRRTALGVTDPFASMQALARIIKDPKTFGTPAVRAEMIIRTEVNRTFDLATADRMRQANKRLGGGLKKYWLTAGDQRVREAHVIAGRQYAIGGDPGPIPIEQAFVVDGEKLMHPLDPQGSASNTISCRCKSIPYVADVSMPGRVRRAA